MERIEFRIHVGHCRQCGERVQGRHPRQTSQAVGQRGLTAGTAGAGSGHIPGNCGCATKGLLYCELLDFVFVQAELIADGVLLRGSITFGDIFIDDKTVFGPALIRAYELEDQVSIAPRVIVDPEVFPLLEKYPVLRAHAVEDEMQYLCHLLKKDADGVWFIDYLRVMAAQVDDQAAYLRFLKAHRQLILDRLPEFNQLNSVLTKYGWLVTYHNTWVNGLNDDALNKLGASKENAAGAGRHYALASFNP